jgi:hypothetical protein
MRTLATVLACLCVVLAVACVSLIAARPLAASAPDKPAAPEAAPQVGRYQKFDARGDCLLLDTATGRVWRAERNGDVTRWVPSIEPPKQEKP